MRIIPSSLFWFGPFQSEKPASYATNTTKATSFLTKQLGESCKIAPKNASLKRSNNTLTVVPAEDGGSCDKNEALGRLLAAKPVVNTQITVEIPVKTLPPNVTDDTAEKLAKELNGKTSSGVVIDEIAGDSVTVPQAEILGWLTFQPRGKSLQYSVDPEKAKPFLDKTVTPKAAKPAAATADAPIETAPTPPETFTIGVTDLTFNPVNGVYNRQLNTPDGRTVTPWYWKQKETVSNDDVWYWKKR